MKIKESLMLKRSSISSKKVHCCLVALILFILIFLSLPIWLIQLANTRYENCRRGIRSEQQDINNINSTSAIVNIPPEVQTDSSLNQSPAATITTAQSISSSSFASGFSSRTRSEVHETLDNKRDNFCFHENEMPPPAPKCPSSTSNYTSAQDIFSQEDKKLQCPLGTSVCPTCPDICIHNSRNCDGYYDCPDGSDESDCLNNLSLTADQSNTNNNQVDGTGAIGVIYKNVIFAQNGSPTNATGTESHFVLPRNCNYSQILSNLCPCDTEDPYVIICENLNFTQIPVGLRPTVFKLRLSNNLISDIDSVQWPKSLATLVILDNKITKIGKFAFKTAPKLGRLHLSQNEISFIDREAFAGLNHLTWLQLEANKLETFYSQALKDSPLINKLYLSENMIDLPDETRFGAYGNLRELILDYNKISRIKSHWFSNMSSLYWLSMMHNEISYIEDGAFDWDYELYELNLGFNRIKVINRQTFATRLNIQRLYLSGNPLAPLASNAFMEIVELRSLSLSQVKFDYIKKDTFTCLTKLDFIYFWKFRYCQYAPQARVCRPKTDGLSSRDSLLVFPILKDSVKIVAIVCSLGNVFVFIWRTVSSDEDRTLSLFIRNLSIADLMMGIYLATISWYADMYERHFRSNAIKWITSRECAAIGFLAILSSELSVFILTIITIERYRAITSRYKLDEEANERRAKFYVKLAWLFSILIASYPLIEFIFRDPDHYITNSLCLPLHIDQPYTPGWQYSAFIYLGINTLAVILIIALYVRMYSTIMEAHRATKPAHLFCSSRQAADERREDTILAIRFFFIVLTDCLCLIPIVVIKIMAYLEVEISSAIYGWLVVFIIPINSALNPIIYTLAAPSSFRDATCRLLSRLWLKLDQLGGLWRDSQFHVPVTRLRVSGGGGSSWSSSLSSSAGSSVRELDRASGSRARRKKTGSSSSTTCDTIDDSATGSASDGHRQSSSAADCAIESAPLKDVVVVAQAAEHIATSDDISASSHMVADGSMFSLIHSAGRRLDASVADKKTHDLSEAAYACKVTSSTAKSQVAEQPSRPAPRLKQQAAGKGRRSAAGAGERGGQGLGARTHLSRANYDPFERRTSFDLIDDRRTVGLRGDPEPTAAGERRYSNPVEGAGAASRRPAAAPLVLMYQLLNGSGCSMVTESELEEDDGLLVTSQISARSSSNCSSAHNSRSTLIRSNNNNNKAPETMREKQQRQSRVSFDSKDSRTCLLSNEQ